MTSLKPSSSGLITPERLADLDEARDYNAASSYNWLNAELGRLLQVIQSNGTVHVELDSGTISLATERAFLAWARERYPAATIRKQS